MLTIGTKGKKPKKRAFQERKREANGRFKAK